MKLLINEVEYTIKSRQAIEILNLVEKSGILNKFKEASNVGTEGSVFDSIGSTLPMAYELAYEVLAIATGSFSKGTLTKNTDLVDDLEALELPMHALQIVKTLMFPISYAMTDDRQMAEQKKTNSSDSSDTSPGKSESSFVREAL